MKIVLVSAAKFESTPTFELLKSHGINALQIEVGIGPLNAAKNCRQVAAQAQDQHVVFMGTAGTFGEFNKPYLVTAGEVIWLPTSVRTSQAYLIDGIEPPIPAIKHSALFQGLQTATVICCPAISKITTLPPSFSTHTHVVENLELYSCIAEISESASQFDTVLGITNQIGESAHVQWKMNFQHCAKLSAEYILSKLTGKN